MAGGTVEVVRRLNGADDVRYTERIPVGTDVSFEETEHDGEPVFRITFIGPLSAEHPDNQPKPKRRSTRKAAKKAPKRKAPAKKKAAAKPRKKAAARKTTKKSTAKK
ncbi:MAG TPA: hypothetical protein VFQ40_07440 [Actinomycetota bacterium]|nr:hypothetical protein [Actinomycetota bacterium]